MSSTHSKEKRGDARVPADLRLRLSGAEEMLELQVANVSMGGAYCHSPRTFEPMTRMNIVLELPAPFVHVTPANQRSGSR